MKKQFPFQRNLLITVKKDKNKENNAIFSLLLSFTPSWSAIYSRRNNIGAHKIQNNFDAIKLSFFQYCCKSSLLHFDTSFLSNFFDCSLKGNSVKLSSTFRYSLQERQRAINIAVSIAGRFITVWGVIQKRNHETMYIVQHRQKMKQSDFAFWVHPYYFQNTAHILKTK